MYVSRHACSRTTIKRRVESLSALVFGALGAAGIMVGFSGGDPGAGRFRETGLLGFSIGMAAGPGLPPVVAGTNEGAETERTDDPAAFLLLLPLAAASAPLTGAGDA